MIRLEKRICCLSGHGIFLRLSFGDSPVSQGDYQWIFRLQGTSEFHRALFQQYYQIVLSGPFCGIPPAVIKPHDQKLSLAYG